MDTFSGKQPSPPEERLIKNQSFWPDFDIHDFSVRYRVPNEVNTSSITEQLVQAMTDINLRLSDFEAQHRANGFTELIAVPSDKIEGESILARLYRRAVSCRAKASICRDYPTIDRREPAENQAKSAEETERVYLRYADEATRQMLNESDITVELI